MIEYQRKNAIIKRAYHLYLIHARGLSDKSIEQVECAIGHFEDYREADFCAFNPDVAVEFKSFLYDGVSEKTGEPLSNSMISKICRNNRDFLEWLAGQHEFEPLFTVDDAAYLNPTVSMREASRRRPIVSVPDMDQFVGAIRAMPHGTMFERRNRAAMAMLGLSGARADAIASLRINSIDLGKRLVDQDGTLVRTKRRKRIVTWFFPVGPDMLGIAADWWRELNGLGYTGADPLFPADERAVGPDGLLESTGLSRKVWESAHPVRKIFRKMCEDAGIPCRHPHAIRRSLVKMAFRSPYTMEQLKSWSQNLGHSSIETTVMIYAEIPDWRREEIMRELWSGDVGPTGASASAVAPQLDPIVAMLRGYGFKVTPPKAA